MDIRFPLARKTNNRLKATAVILVHILTHIFAIPIVQGYRSTLYCVLTYIQFSHYMRVKTSKKTRGSGIYNSGTITLNSTRVNLFLSYN